MSDNFLKRSTKNLFLKKRSWSTSLHASREEHNLYLVLNIFFISDVSVSLTYS